MRKVTAIINVKNANGKWEPQTINGVFHEWGVDYEEFESGPAPFSVGIIELSDGTIKTALPEKIQFIDDTFYF